MVFVKDSVYQINIIIMQISNNHITSSDIIKHYKYLFIYIECRISEKETKREKMVSLEARNLLVEYVIKSI